MAEINVTIDNIKISNGTYLTFEQSQKNPDITFKYLPEEYYTIAVVDPDAPSRDNPIHRYWLHLLIINNNDKLISYQKPSPPSGSGNHRYIFYLLKQSYLIDIDDVNLKNSETPEFEPFVRQKFNLPKFISNNDLEIVDSVYFETSR